MAAPQPHPGILEIAPYVGGSSSLPGRASVIKLSSNEGPFGPSPATRQAFQDAALDLHRYPDIASQPLRDAIGQVHDLDPARIVCGCGSDEFFLTLCQAYAGPGSEIIYTEHGFLMYPIAALASGARPVVAPETDLRADIDAIVSRVTADTRIVFIANPNNPTGTCLSRDELDRLRRGLPDHVLLVVDSAYAEFVDRPDYDPGHDLVDRYDNVVMTRTFSKIYALGGARVGWCYGPPAIVDILNRIRNPFNISGPAQAAAQAAVLDQEFVAKSQAHNRIWRGWLREQLTGMGLRVPESEGNFVLAVLGDGQAPDADAFLRERGILVRRMESYGLPHALRISIGLEEELRPLVEGLRTFLGQATTS